MHKCTKQQESERSKIEYNFRIEFGFLLKKVMMNQMQVKVNQLLNWEDAIN